MFKPQLLDSLKNYDKIKFSKDVVAGVIVGIVALPLAIAFAIASGVTPETGLITAVVAGFIISAFGGSKVQIGGPTGAFIVIVYGIVQTYGVDGLIVSTFIAGLILMIMGFARLGGVIKYIPHPLIVGFTSGIALIIFSSQIKDVFGMTSGNLPADFIDKILYYSENLHTLNTTSLGIAIITILIIIGVPKINHKIPGSLIAIISTTSLVYFLNLPVETIGSKFGNIPSGLPMPHFPHIDFHTVQKLIQPAFTIALLGGIESLLSAVVADGMTGSKHKSNVELVAQGMANIASAAFGGIPATGAIARTATNVKNGAVSPIAGIIHALTLLLIMLLFAPLAKLIPMACLAGVLVVVAYNMSEWKSFVSIARGPYRDAGILIVTFLLTVLVDLTVAIQVGMVLSAFIFMEKMSSLSKINLVSNEDSDEVNDPKSISNFKLPQGVEVFEIEGPLFFGAAYKFREEIKILQNKPKALILRMRFVPYIDETGLHAIEEFFEATKKNGTKLVLSGVREEILKDLIKSGVANKIGLDNIKSVIDDAVARVWELTNE